MTNCDGDERYGLLLGIDDPHRRLSVALGQCYPGKLNDGI